MEQFKHSVMPFPGSIVLNMPVSGLIL